MKSKTHPRKALLGAFLICGLAAQGFGANVQIASFATGSFTVDGGTYSMTTSVNGITGNGAIGVGNNTSFGSWQSFISPATSNWSTYEGFGLLMSVSGTNPQLFFTVQLYSGVEYDVVASFTGSTTGVGNTLTSVLLNLNADSPNSLADLTNVRGFQITWNGDSATSDLTLAGIESVPEPSSVSLLMLGAAGLVALRRLRKV